MKVSLKFREVRPKHWKRDRLDSWLARFPDFKVLVIGDVGIDRYVVGAVDRISPEAPVPIVLVKEERLKLGLAANVADNIRALGAEPLLVGAVGADRGAADFKKILKQSRISARHIVVDPNIRTVLKERIVSERQQLLRVDYEADAPLSEAAQSALIKRVRALVKECDAVILEDYAKGCLTRKLAQAAITAAKAARKTVCVDPNAKSDITAYRGAHVLTPNTKEAEALSGIQITDKESLVAAGRALLRLTAVRHVVIKRGKDGMAIFSRGSKETLMISTYAREVYDVSGAGDTVVSVLALALAAGAEIDEAAILGNLAAGVEVGKRGTATVSRDEIAAAMELFSRLG